MHDFGKIAYLDVHKTGSSYVSKFLDSCCTLKQVRFEKHDWVREDYRADCFYFITLRNPYDMWSSLYRYGLDGRGDVYHRLRRANMLGCYETFDKFVNFCLDEEHANLLGYEYNSEISEFIGFMSFRFLKLSLQFPMRHIKYCLSKGLSLSTLENNFITRLEIKNEKLNEQLATLSLERFPQYFDAVRVQDFFLNNFRINQSRNTKNEVDSLTGDTLKRMHSKEWLLISRY